jgi:hypothetical protein
MNIEHAYLRIIIIIIFQYPSLERLKIDDDCNSASEGDIVSGGIFTEGKKSQISIYLR